MVNAIHYVRKFVDKFEIWKSSHALANETLISCARETIDKVWVHNEISQDFSPEFINNIANEMMIEVTNVISASNPYQLNRAKLATSVLNFAEYQVLVMDPYPATDLTGFRCTQVTGALKVNLEKLSKVKNHLKIWTGNNSNTIPTDKDLWSLVLSNYKVCWAWSELFQALNTTLEGNPDTMPDWYKPFIHSMCANKEHHFRLDLAMPSVLNANEATANIIALEHSLFFNLVRIGLHQPFEAWKSIVDHIEYENDEVNQLEAYHMYLAQYPT